MKIIMKSDISSLDLIFCHEFFMESPWVFSYDLENSRCCQNVIQRAPIHCACNAVQMYSQFWKILGFIAWRFHILQRQEGIEPGGDILHMDRLTELVLQERVSCGCGCHELD